MTPVTAEQLQPLEPYIAGAQPDDRGELEIYCPVHKDSKRSASINMQKGVWYCHAGCGGGSLRQLLLAEEAWEPVNGRNMVHYANAPATAQARTVGLEDVTHWHRRLRREDAVRGRIQRLRGLTRRTLRRALVGWDGRSYKLPVFSPTRRLWNVRNYDPEPRNGRSKVWNTRGMGDARLYPISMLVRARLGQAVLITEGEWDALLAVQTGYLSVTRTDGAGKPWRPEWTPLFVGLRVYVCHDMDEAGARSDSITVHALADAAAEVYLCRLPYERTERHGKDLTDFLLDQPGPMRGLALGELMMNARRVA